MFFFFFLRLEPLKTQDRPCSPNNPKEGANHEFPKVFLPLFFKEEQKNDIKIEEKMSRLCAVFLWVFL